MGFDLGRRRGNLGERGRSPAIVLLLVDGIGSIFLTKICKNLRNCNRFFRGNFLEKEGAIA
ncbi:MAG: hypothetical protein D6680_06575 [Cyanobacteria bacterium J007]|nr:MAG: hypothetical protein D6680_06575 [Cyanobacteria bacterium J007]